MKKNYFKYIALGLCALNLLLFLRFYVTDYLPSVNLLKVADGVYFALYYPAKLIEFCLAPLSAIAVFALFHGNTKKILISSLLLSVPRAVYLIPYYYLYENAYGNDSLESLGLSLFITVGGILILTLHVLLLAFILNLVVSVSVRGRICRQTPYFKKEEHRAELTAEVRENMGSEICKKGFFDLSLPIVAAIFAVSFLEFLYPLINEIIKTADFFAEYADSYTSGEIFSICFSFIFALAELILLHVFGILLKDLLIGTDSPSSDL